MALINKMAAGWLSYVEKEFETQKEEKYLLWKFIGGITFVIGAFMILISGYEWNIILPTLLALMAFLAVVAYLTPRYIKWRNMNVMSEAYIAKNGVYLTGEFHNWDMINTKLLKAIYNKKTN